MQNFPGAISLSSLLGPIHTEHLYAPASSGPPPVDGWFMVHRINRNYIEQTIIVGLLPKVSYSKLLMYSFRVGPYGAFAPASSQPPLDGGFMVSRIVKVRVSQPRLLVIKKLANNDSNNHKFKLPALFPAYDIRHQEKEQVQHLEKGY